MSPFSPSTEGSAPIRAPARVFMEAFARRVETGLLPRATRSRSQYVVVHQGPDRLRFCATTWWTAINVGLNDVELRIAPDGGVRYTIQYWRWAAYALALGGFLGVLLIAVFLALDIREYVARNPTSQFPGLSIDQSVAIAWAMATFWGFVWPWILIALHKRPLRRLMGQIIAEVDAAAT